MNLASRLARLAGFQPLPQPELRIEPRLEPRLEPTGRPRKAAAQGVAKGLTRTIVVRVDDATFARIDRAAAFASVTTTEAIRQLIERGLSAREL
jgi:hypothetical protein